MQKVSLTALAREHLASAAAAPSGRSAHTVYGGHEHVLRQTLIALTAGQDLHEHENPGEATLQVLHGRVRLTTGPTSWDGAPGDHLTIPDSRHSLHANEDSVVLLTVAKTLNHKHASHQTDDAATEHAGTGHAGSAQPVVPGSTT